MEKNTENFVKCYMVSWDEAYKLATILARNIKKSGFDPELIIGIARGGLIPACIICDFLNKKDITTINVEHWGTATIHERAEIKQPLLVDISGKKVLIVDDVADTGGTFSEIIDYVKNMNPMEIKTAALQYKTCSVFIPDYWVEKQDKWKWIMYPWAKYEDMTEFIEKILTHPLTLRNLRKSLKSNFDIKVSEMDLLNLLKDMQMAGKIQKIKRDSKILWDKC